MRRRALVVGAALALAACSGGSTGLGPALAGRSFTADGSAVGAQHPPIVAGSTIAISFEEGSIAANAGCNHMGGPARFEGDTLVLPEGLAMTEMACAEDLMEQERWVADLLASRPSVTIPDDGADVLVRGAQVSLALVEVADTPLVGTVWQLTAIGGTAPEDPVSTVDGSSTLTFTQDGGYEVLTACTGGGSLGASGPVTTSADQLDLGPADPEDDGCADPYSDLMAEVMGLLVGPVGYRVDGSSLVLTSDGVQLVYVARPQASPEPTS